VEREEEGKQISKNAEGGKSRVDRLFSSRSSVFCAFSSATCRLNCVTLSLRRLRKMGMEAVVRDVVDPPLMPNEEGVGERAIVAVEGRRSALVSLEHTRVGWACTVTLP
jgi:hypothetical protein